MSYSQTDWPDKPARALWNAWEYSQSLLNALPPTEEVSEVVIVEQIRITTTVKSALATFE